LKYKNSKLKIFFSFFNEKTPLLKNYNVFKLGIKIKSNKKENKKLLKKINCALLGA
jgi:hypothetical protein